MPAAQGEAAVDIVVDASRVPGELQSKLDSAARGVRIDTSQIAGQLQSGIRTATDQGAAELGDLGDAARRAGDEIGDGISAGADEAGDALAREFARSGERAEDALGEVGDRGEREFDRIEREAKDAGSSMRGKLTAAAGAIAAAFAAIQVGQFLGDAVQEAADLGESINAVNVVLQEGADSFLEFGQTAADELGITQAALNELVVPVAALLREAGSGGEQLSGQLQDLSTRATDVASVFNKDVNEVLTAFGSALRGETEPIRAFGVQLNAAAIEAKAMELGLADASGEIDQAAKTQAAFALVMEQTSTAAGDFQNTADSLPNLMRRIRATLTETAGALGEALLPALTEILDAALPAITSLGPLFEILGASIAEAITTLGPTLQIVFLNLQEGLEALTPAITPVLSTVGQLLGSLAPLLPLIGELAGTLLPPLATILGIVADVGGSLIEVFAQLVSDALAQLAPFLPTLTELLTEIGNVIGFAVNIALESLVSLWAQVDGAITPLIPLLLELVAAILPLVRPLLELVDQLLPPLVELLAGLVAPIIQLLHPIIELATALAGVLVDALLTVAEIIGGALDAVLPILTDLLLTVLDAVLPLVPALLGLVEALLPLLTPILDLVAVLLPPLVQLLALLLEPILALIGPIIRLVSTLLELLINSALTPLIELLVEAMMPSLEALTALLEGDVSGAFEAAGGHMVLLRDIALAVWEAISSFVMGRINAIVVAVNRIRGFVDRIRSFFDQARAAVLDRINAVVALVRGLPGRILRGLGNVGRLLRQAGRNIIQGLIDGIRDMIGNVASTIGDVAETVRNYLPFSPAKVGPLSGSGDPERAGARIADLVAQGIADQLPAIEAAADQLAGAARLDRIADTVPALDPGLDAAIAASLLRGGDGATAGASAPGQGVRVWPTPPPADPPELVIRGDGTPLAELLIQVLARAIRQKGGNVQTVLGTGRGGGRR